MKIGEQPKSMEREESKGKKRGIRETERKVSLAEKRDARRWKNWKMRT